MIDVQNLSYVYSPKTPFAKQALFDISMTIEDGDFFGIIGSTGAGKSTLINHFNALIRIKKKIKKKEKTGRKSKAGDAKKRKPDIANYGTVFVDNADLSSKKLDVKKLRAKVGMVFQYPEHQLFDDTVEKDVSFGPKNLGLSKQEQIERARTAIELVGLNYDEVAGRSPLELSGGQKRRVALAGVIAMRPQILVLDEPTAGLDPKGKREIMELVLRVKQSCPTVVMISHNMDEIAAYCNKIAVMSRGRLFGVYTPRELFGSRQTIEECNVRLPLVTEIASGLNDAGLDIDPSLLDEDELAEAIIKAKFGIRNQ